MATQHLPQSETRTPKNMKRIKQERKRGDRVEDGRMGVEKVLVSLS
jgi:hypothetical protein